MVAPTPEKSFFEGNSPSNLQPLFFEFALEPTPVSFKPQPKLSTPPVLSKGKEILNIASRVALGLLISGLVLGSGILSSELFMGKSANQANLSWIPSWSEDSPVAPKTATASLGMTGISEAPAANSATNTVTSETNNSFRFLVANAAAADPAGTPTSKTDSKAATTPKPTETNKPPLKPIIKAPVSRSDIRPSNTVTDRTVAVANTAEITSEAFHAIKAQSVLDGKKIFIKFGARWCLPCKMMEKNVFPDPEISRLLAKNYHTLTVDIDNIDGINLRQFYNVEALPSFVILDSQQNIVGKYEGAQRIDELRGILGSAAP